MDIDHLGSVHHVQYNHEGGITQNHDNQIGLILILSLLVSATWRYRKHWHSDVTLWVCPPSLKILDPPLQLAKYFRMLDEYITQS